MRRIWPELDFAPYKKPLRRVQGGFGYMGVVAKTKDGAKLQCHLCGELYANLGTHIRKGHKLTNDEYRDRFELSKSTRLISPEVREKYVAAYAAASPDLKIQRIKAMSKGRKMKPRHTYWHKSLEQKNREGICPDQLIHKIRKLAKSLGHTPTLKEFRDHYHGLALTVYRTFGSWSNALEIAKLEKNHIGLVPRYSRETLMTMMVGFRKVHGRRPYTGDLSHDLPSQFTFTKYFGSFSAAVKALEQEHPL